MGTFVHHVETLADHRLLDVQRVSELQLALPGLAGHELRQPMQVFQTAIEWLGCRLGMAFDPARRERIEQAITRLLEGALRLYGHTKSIQMPPGQLAPLVWRFATDNVEVATSCADAMRQLWS